MRWTQVEASRFPHEKEAHDLLRDALHDQEPYRGWSNLEFIAQYVSINEVANQKEKEKKKELKSLLFAACDSP